ncbi:MAG: hypothetical protein CVV30_12375 [Methanomicrobiales archaeon HGW-Methanomicrobiales-1]|jgi:glucan phosphoethanolaminetransferase (alkaline phosphatase superfamily)|nr:MAG: hypothetical protein CVV30_12375 [Methanomicrobiales archaeon HGW-Methanomicrobiales-1]
MNEVILLLLAVVGIFSIACSVALIALGKIIDNFPMENEENRTRGISSPEASTKLSVVLFWVLFFPGAWAVLQEGILTRIMGITALFSICLFMFTALVFSFAVLSAMRGRKNAIDETIVRTGSPAPAVSSLTPVITQKSAVSQKGRKNPLSNIMVNALLKK